MVEIKIINKIKEQVEIYQEKTGVKKGFIIDKMGYKSRQAFDKAMKNVSNSLDTYARFAHFLKLDISEMYEIKIIENNN